jgi:hypothetical protein
MWPFLAKTNLFRRRFTPRRRAFCAVTDRMNQYSEFLGVWGLYPIKTQLPIPILNIYAIGLGIYHAYTRYGLL